MMNTSIKNLFAPKNQNSKSSIQNTMNASNNPIQQPNPNTQPSNTNPMNTSTQNPSIQKEMNTPELLAQQMPEQSLNLLNDSVFDQLIHDDNSIREELEKYGRLKCSDNGAHHECLEAQMESIFEAYKRTTTKKVEATERQRRATNGQIEQLEKKIEQAKEKMDRIRSQMEEKKAEISLQVKTLRNKLDNIREEIIDTPPTNWVNEIVGWSIVVVTAVFLFVFYTNVAFQAFFSDPIDFENIDEAEIAKRLSETGVFKLDTFYRGLESIFSPLFTIVPFLFAYFLHLVLEKASKSESRFRYMSVAVVIAVVFFVDFVIAHIIHANIDDLKTKLSQLTGLAHFSIPFYKDSNFYIIIICGFLTFLVLGFLFHNLLKMRDERNPFKSRIIREAEYKQKLQEAEAKLREIITELEAFIETMYAEINGYTIKISELHASLEDDNELELKYDGKLKLCLTSFFTGWLSTVRFLGYSINDHRQAYATFLQRHFGQSVVMSENLPNN